MDRRLKKNWDHAIKVVDIFFWNQYIIIGNNSMVLVLCG